MILTSSLLSLVPKETANSQNQTLHNYLTTKKVCYDETLHFGRMKMTSLVLPSYQASL